MRKRFEYHNIRRVGEKYYGRHLCFQYSIFKDGSPKLGITVSKKFGGAIKRNFFKRRVREIFRKKAKNFYSPITINILPLLSSKRATYHDFEKDFESFITHTKKGSENEVKT